LAAVPEVDSDRVAVVAAGVRLAAEVDPVAGEVDSVEAVAALGAVAVDSAAVVGVEPAAGPAIALR
jgi:hypothetical protein